MILKHIADNDDEGCKEACQGLEMRSRLIRRDTGKCICINDYEISDSCMGEGYFQQHMELKPTARNPSGAIARDVCFHHEYKYADFITDFAMERISDLEYKIKSFGFKLNVSGGRFSNEDTKFNCMNHFLLFLEGLDWK